MVVYKYIIKNLLKLQTRCLKMSSLNKRRIVMAKLNNDWWNAFRGAFQTEEEVIEFIFKRLDTSDFEDSYIDMGGHREPNECFKQSAEDKRQLLYDFMMELIK